MRRPPAAHAEARRAWLHSATANNNLPALLHLIQARADINAKDNESVSPINLAAARNNVSSAPPLHTAVTHVRVQVEAMRALLDAGCTVLQGRDRWGRSALHVAAVRGQVCVCVSVCGDRRRRLG